MKAITENIPLNMSFAESEFFKNANLLGVSPEDYFNQFDFKLLELNRDPVSWNKSDWETFRDAVQIDAEVIFMKRNNL